MDMLPVALAAILGRNLPAALRSGIARILGPATDEVALWLQDKLRACRVMGAARVLPRAYAKLKKAGVDPQSVPPKLLFPILEGASYEDPSSELVEQWAGLLATAAAGEAVLVSHAKILADLTPVEGQLLQAMYDAYVKPMGLQLNTVDEVAWNFDDLVESSAQAPGQLRLLCENLARLCLMTPTVAVAGGDIRGGNVQTSFGRISLSVLGHDFVRCCNGPKAQDAG